MKGGIVAMLYGMRALKESGAGLEGKIGLMLMPDEETGSERGSACLAMEKLLGRGGIGMRKRGHLARVPVRRGRSCARECLKLCVT